MLVKIQPFFAIMFVPTHACLINRIRAHCFKQLMHKLFAQESKCKSEINKIELYAMVHLDPLSIYLSITIYMYIRNMVITCICVYSRSRVYNKINDGRRAVWQRRNGSPKGIHPLIKSDYSSEQNSRNELNFAESSGNRISGWYESIAISRFQHYHLFSMCLLFENAIFGHRFSIASVGCVRVWCTFF